MSIRRVLALVAAFGFVVTLAPDATAHTEGSVSGAVDPTRLPVGPAPASAPAVGTVFSCQTQFPANAPGAFATGSWFNGDATFDPAKKPTVDGAVTWPDAGVQFKVKGSKRVITGTGLPVSHTTGNFPVASSDDAYAYDRNPNTITRQTVSITLPKNPKVAAAPTCLGLGAIGILKSGVVLFNALDAGGRDAVAYEIQDGCQGHPERSGTYHDHSVSSCLLDDVDTGTGHSKLVGYAADGFGIYGPRGEGGTALTNADLDECHGHTHTIRWDGRRVRRYHYHATAEYPYTLGCYRGTPVR